MASVAIAMAASFLLYMGIHTTAYDWIDRTQCTQEAYAQQKVRTEEALQQYIRDEHRSLRFKSVERVGRKGGVCGDGHLPFRACNLFLVSL